MWLGFGLGSSAGLMVISQLVPFARSQGIPSAALATMSLVVGAAGECVGKSGLRLAFRRAWAARHLRVILAISMIAMPALYSVGGAM